MRDIYKNAVDSLKVGMQFFLSDDSYTSRKHAILTLFHAIELLLKEYLYRVNPILIYRNIDRKITDDSITVGIGEILIRLENIKVSLPPEQISAIKKIQKKRNQIEHHRYDKKDEDEETIGESLKFILFFMEFRLDEKPSEDLDEELLRGIQRLVLEYDERLGHAEWRFQRWLQDQWPEWDPYQQDTPEEFGGTLDCPECGMSYLVIEFRPEPFCFYCNTPIEATECVDCGVVYKSSETHACW